MAAAECRGVEDRAGEEAGAVSGEGFGEGGKGKDAGEEVDDEFMTLVWAVVLWVVYNG